MRMARGHGGLAILAVCAALACNATSTTQSNATTTGSPVSPGAIPSKFSALVFSRTEGFRHDSIPAGIAAIRRLGQELGFSVEATENSAAFSDEGLSAYKVVIFLSTTGDVLDEAQQAAFERFIRSGGGFVGVHSAADTVRVAVLRSAPRRVFREPSGYSNRNGAD